MKKFQKQRDELISRLFRYVCWPISNLLIKHTNIHPNHITAISFIFVIMAAAFFVKGGYQNIVIGGILGFIYVLIDHIDGVVARIKKLGSSKGKWLDGIIGIISPPLLMFTLAIGMNDKIVIAVAALAMVCFPLQYAIVYFYKAEVTKSTKKINIHVPSKLDDVRYIYGASLFYALLLIACLINRPFWLLLFYAVIGNLFWMGILALQYINILKNTK